MFDCRLFICYINSPIETIVFSSEDDEDYEDCETDGWSRKSFYCLSPLPSFSVNSDETIIWNSEKFWDFWAVEEEIRFLYISSLSMQEVLTLDEITI